jgi:NAD-dependent deacetylase
MRVDQSPDAWGRDSRPVWELCSIRRSVASAAKPNPAHFALAELERRLEDRLFLCTQNVDDLHEQAGSKRVVHLHGELFKSRCDICSRPPFREHPHGRIGLAILPDRAPLSIPSLLKMIFIGSGR